MAQQGVQYQRHVPQCWTRLPLASLNGRAQVGARAVGWAQLLGNCQGGSLAEPRPCSGLLASELCRLGASIRPSYTLM